MVEKRHKPLPTITDNVSLLTVCVTPFSTKTRPKPWKKNLVLFFIWMCAHRDILCNLLSWFLRLNVIADSQKEIQKWNMLQTCIFYSLCFIYFSLFSTCVDWCFKTIWISRMGGWLFCVRAIRQMWRQKESRKINAPIIRSQSISTCEFVCGQKLQMASDWNMLQVGKLLMRVFKIGSSYWKKIRWVTNDSDKRTKWYIHTVYPS